jgi:hypothetical protein
VSSSEESNIARAELAKFMQVVAKDPQVRAQFANSPDETLADQEISGLGSELVGFLRALSEEELAFASRLNTTLIDLGLGEDFDGNTLAYL